MPTDVLDTCSDLLPFHLLVKKVMHRAATWLASLPSSHPLYTHIQKAARRYVKHHRVPLHEVMHALDMWPNKLEKIRPVRCRSKWEPGAKMQIPDCMSRSVPHAKSRTINCYISNIGRYLTDPSRFHPTQSALIMTNLTLRPAPIAVETMDRTWIERSSHGRGNVEAL